MTKTQVTPDPTEDTLALHQLLAYRAGHQPDTLNVGHIRIQRDDSPHVTTIINTPNGTVELPNLRAPDMLLEHLLHRYPVPVYINGIHLTPAERLLNPQLTPITPRIPAESAPENSPPPLLHKMPHVIIQGLSYLHRNTLDRQLSIISIPDYDNEQPLYWPTIPHTMDLNIELPEQHLPECNLTILHDTPHAILSGDALQAYKQLAFEQFDQALAQSHYTGDHTAYQDQKFVSTWDSVISIPKEHANLVTVYGDPDYYLTNTSYSLRHLFPPTDPIPFTLHQAIIDRPNNQDLPVMLPINREIRHPDYTCEGITFTLADRQTIHLSQQHFKKPPAASIPQAPSTVQSIMLHVLITEPDRSTRRTTIPAHIALLGSPRHEVIVFTHGFQSDTEQLHKSILRVYREPEPTDLGETEADQFDQREENRLRNLAIQATLGPHQAFRASLIEHWQNFCPYQPMPDEFDLPVELSRLPDMTTTPPKVT